MARPPRLQVPGGIYHVFARGNRGQQLYVDAVDRFRFLGLLEEVVVWLGWMLHAYCLLSNHYHLVVQTPKADLSRGMHRLNGLSAQRFNRTHDVGGHLFQGRFGSVLVESEAQFLAVCRYVALNPVLAGLCSDPADWRWSSYAATVGLAPRPPFLTIGLVLGHFGRAEDEAREAYRRFVVGGLADSTGRVAA
jgi:REP element-mobilizing transposase RayT